MQAKYTPNEIERFWGYINKEISNIFYNGTRCWEWVGGRNSQGYGAAWMGNKNCRAHRASYEIFFGEISVDLQVLHHCDNPPCCNPDHLFLGTTQDNVDDRTQKGRHGYTAPKSPAHGESHGRRKLSDEQIVEIRRRYAWHGKGGSTTYQLAEEFGVHQAQIWRILKNKNWKTE